MMDASYRILVDSRESKILALMREKNDYKVCKGLLDVGDVHILKEDELLYVLERKTFSDFEGSLRDGRYREQRGRLSLLSQESGGRVKIAYLLEGGGPTSKRPASLLRSSVNRLEDDGFVPEVVEHCWLKSFCLGYPVTFLLSRGPEDSVRMIEDIIKIHHSSAGSEESSSCHKAEMRRSFKKQDVAIGDSPCLYLWKLTLTGIPRVSLAMASKIVEVYPTIQDFVEAPPEEIVRVLKDLVVGKRRVGEKMARKVISFFFSTTTGTCLDSTS